MKEWGRVGKVRGGGRGYREDKRALSILLKLFHYFSEGILAEIILQFLLLAGNPNVNFI